MKRQTSVLENQPKIKVKKTNDVASTSQGIDKKALRTTDSLNSTMSYNMEKPKNLMKMSEQELVAMEINDTTLNLSTMTESEKPDPNKESSENCTEDVVLTVSNRQQSMNMHTLPNELLTDIIKWLPLKELCTIRHTSGVFRQIAADCFQRNYSSTWALYQGSKGIICNYGGIKIQAVAQLVR